MINPTIIAPKTVHFSDMFKNNIQKTLNTSNPSFTLRESVIELLLVHYSAESQIEFFELFELLHSNELKQSELKDKLEVIFKKNVNLKISVQLILQLGEKYLDTPLFDILSEKAPETTSEVRLLQRINLYQSFYSVINNTCFDIAKQLEEALDLGPLYSSENDPVIKKLLNFLNPAVNIYKILKENTAIIHSVLESTTMTISEIPAANDFNFLKAKHVANICTKTLKKTDELALSQSKKLLEGIKKLEFQIDLPNPVRMNYLFLEILNERLQSLLDQYHELTGKKTDTAIHLAYTDYLFQDEFLAEKKRYEAKIIKQKIHFEPVKTEEKVEKPILQPSVIPTPEKKPGHSTQIHELSLKIKKSIPGMYSRELRDHLTFASLNFNLFCRAIENNDTKALSAIIPFFCMDIHIVNEQLIKSQSNTWLKSHNLSKLRAIVDTPKEDPELEAFFTNFSDALLQVRYPIEKNVIAGPLKWLLVTPNNKDLPFLCQFVLNSYEQTLKHVCKAVGHETIDCSFAAPIFQNATLKKSPLTKTPILTLRDRLLKKNEKRKDQTLLEVANHLITFDAVVYLQERYPDLQFAALHQRNCMMSGWPAEKVLALAAIREGMGDPRYLSDDPSSANHDLIVFHAMILPTKEIPTALKDFNLGRKLHYHREEKNSPLLKDLDFARKNLKKLDPDDPNFTLANQKLPESFAQILVKNRKETINKGIDLLEKILISTQNI